MSRTQSDLGTDPASLSQFTTCTAKDRLTLRGSAASLPTGSAVLSGVDLAGRKAVQRMSESVPECVGRSTQKQPGNQTVG